ncbi:hypothetical protein [Desulfogranum japonicum]|uniref:hypothetical protein n=1 Tax=Desulfogranum japonicum TaxID=231447 RepID=UPI000422D894|nr:hypothetical protein [Desulfogranum japonicum]
MKLLIDKHQDLFTESTIDEQDGDLCIHGIFLQGNIKNRNGRFYPASVLDKAVNEYVSTYVKTKRSLGELNHPDTPAINPERASHLITDLQREGDNWYGCAKILSTPMGTIVKGLINDGVQLAVSSRGVGSMTKTESAYMVDEDYQLRTIDIVTDPSAPEAFVNGIYEGAEWICQNDEWVQVIEEAKKEIKKPTIAEAFAEIRRQDLLLQQEHKQRYQKHDPISDVIANILRGSIHDH